MGRCRGRLRLHGRVWASVRAYTCGCRHGGKAAALPPGSEKFWGILSRPRCILVRKKKSPMENLERRFCLCQLT